MIALFGRLNNLFNLEVFDTLVRHVPPCHASAVRDLESGFEYANFYDGGFVAIDVDLAPFLYCRVRSERQAFDKRVESIFGPQTNAYRQRKRQKGRYHFD